MLLPQNGTFHFAGAKWANVVERYPKLGTVLQNSTTGDISRIYDSLIETSPSQLACLLNITAAMTQIFLPQGTPLDYLKQIELDDLRPDRFFGWASPAFVQQARMATSQKEFSEQPEIDLLLHTDPKYGRATSSFKQIQFGEANVQLTFHENVTKQIGGEPCIIVEPDSDYYKDPGAHALLEVIPNALTGTLSDPKVVYVLRWIAGQRAGIPEFDPLYTIE